MERIDESPRADTVCGIILLLAALFFFRAVLVGGEAFFSRDIAPFFYPMKDFLARSVRAGEFPLWNPWLLNGEPFFATLQPGALYPGSILLYLLPMPYAFGLTLALHYPLAGVGMYALLRAWNHGVIASLVGGAAFMFGGYLVSIGNFPNNLGTVAWAPWLLLAWVRAVERRKVGQLIGFAVLCAVAFLGGEPQMLGLILLVALAHTLIGVGRVGSDAGRQAQLSMYLAAGVVAIALVAVQLIPFVEMIAHSVRSLATELEYSAGRSLEPASLSQLLVPPVLDAGVYGFTTRRLPTQSTPWLLSLYPGAIVLMFALAGIAGAKSLRWAAFWVVAGLLGVALALGVNSPVYRALHEVLPIIRPFRYPEKFFFLTALSLPVLAARGVDVWTAERRARYVIVPGFLVLAALGACLALLRFDAGLFARLCAGDLAGALMCGDPEVAQRDYLAPVGIAFALTALTVVTVVADRFGRMSTSLAAGLVAALITVDLAVANRAVNPSVEAEIYTEPAWTAGVLQDLQDDPQQWRFRGSSVSAAMGSMVSVIGAWEFSSMYVDFQTLGPNLGQLFGVLSQDGLQGVELESVWMGIDAVLQHQALGNPLPALRMMNVRYYSDPTVAADSLGLQVVATHPELPIRVFEIDDPLPRAYVVTEHRMATDAREALREAIAETFPAREMVMLEETVDYRAVPGSAPTVVDASFGIDEVRIRTSGASDGLLVLTDRFYPGWRATVDDEEVPILRANGIFRAVVVPPGDVKVVFRFEPLSVRVGAWISGVSLLLVMGLFLVAHGRRW